MMNSLFLRRSGFRSKHFLRAHSLWSAPVVKEEVEEGDVNLNLMKKTFALEKQKLYPLNDKSVGPIARSGLDDKLTSLPFVLLLGNHSSGKSSFINHVLGRQIQNTGVAPTDDGFTIITPGQSDLDQDGPALIGNPDIGFSGLRHFGPSLIQKTQLKIRQGIQANNYMMVDSPGMIDSPQNSLHQKHPFVASSNQLSDDPTNNMAELDFPSQSELSDRGYDFAKVMRWYAERSDVILLFFDPDKPGTTGETLSILTKSLVGMDHKLHIILNKVDQFEKIHDFARAYGSLCWNLSKVIPRKDLPRIYTMCLPQQSTGTEHAQTDSGIGAALKDLESTREEVIGEVHRAPVRRADNLITRLHDDAKLLQMHATVLEAVRQHYSRQVWNPRALGLFFLLGGATATCSTLYLGMPMQIPLVISGLSAAGVSAMIWQNSRLCNHLEKVLSSSAGLNEFFQTEYGRQLAEGDEFTLSLWKRVRPQLKVAIRTIGLSNLPKIKASEFQDLRELMQTDIPKLRREMSPTKTSLAHHFGDLFNKPN